MGGAVVAGVFGFFVSQANSVLMLGIAYFFLGKLNRSNRLGMAFANSI